MRRALSRTRAHAAGRAIRNRDFWLLAGTFFICGYTANGLVGTHLIPHAVEHGFSEAVAASTLALMGGINVVGTLTSDWLTDRFDNRKLLATYYGFRALSIAALPFIVDVRGMVLFAMVCGLDWAATLPPTTNLTARLFGQEFAQDVVRLDHPGAHGRRGGRGLFGGFFREVMGDYHYVFLFAALLGFVAVGMSLSIKNPASSTVPRPVVLRPSFPGQRRRAAERPHRSASRAAIPSSTCPLGEEAASARLYSADDAGRRRGGPRGTHHAGAERPAVPRGPGLGAAQPAPPAHQLRRPRARDRRGPAAPRRRATADPHQHPAGSARRGSAMRSPRPGRRVPRRRLAGRAGRARGSDAGPQGRGERAGGARRPGAPTGGDARRRAACRRAPAGAG